MADYDSLVCLPALTAIDKHWYQIETARKVLEQQLGGRSLAMKLDWVKPSKPD